MNDISAFGPREYIARYIIEIKSQGHVLPYQDYELVDRWLLLAQNDPDRLLLVLSEILPDYFTPAEGRAKARSLKPLDRRVSRQLMEIAVRSS
jgi:hypothetical protein